MAVANTNLLELLGKQVSFSWLGADGVTYNFEGQLTTIVFDLESSPQFTVDKSDYFSFDEITDLIHKQNSVLVNCTAGISRLATMVIAYIMKYYKLNLHP